MSVRAKMRCTRYAKFTDGGYSAKVTSIGVTFQPVYGSGDGTNEDKANAEWSKYTPSGEMNLTITNEACFDKFEVGKAYYVDISPAE